MSIILRQMHPAGSAPAPPPPLAFDAQSTGQATGTSLTVSHAVGVSSAYTLLRAVVSVVDPSFINDPAIVTITYNGVAMIKLGSSVNSPSGTRLDTYYVLAPAVGTHNLALTTDANAVIGVAIDSWNGVKQSEPFGAPVINSGSGTAASSGAVTVSAGNYLLAALQIYAGSATTTATPVGNLEHLGNIVAGASPNRLRTIASCNLTDTGSVNAQETLAASKPWAMAAYELKAA